MRGTTFALAGAMMMLEAVYAAPQNYGSGHTSIEPQTPVDDYYISLGPRPYYLVNNMTDGALKSKLLSCENGPFRITDFTIGHRGKSTDPSKAIRAKLCHHISFV
jgi:glycerophosphoryl diester phosphodiesterase